MRRGIKKTYTGLEITKTRVQSVRVGYGSSGWSLLRAKSINFPEEVIKFSYRNKNIVNRDLFLDVVKEALSFGGKEISTVGVALPNEIVKISIQEFGELPDLESEIERMVSWTIEKKLNYPTGSTRSSFHRIGWSDGLEKLLVTTGTIGVIREYELILKELGLNSDIVKPSGISQFNFYAPKIPDKGLVAFLGLFENFFTFYVFKKGRLVFYQGTKKGFGSEHYFDEIDMCFEYYSSVNPDDEIEKLYIGGYSGERETADSLFGPFGNMDIAVLDESLIVGKGKNLELSAEESMASFVPAIGAAQSLLS